MSAHVSYNFDPLLLKKRFPYFEAELTEKIASVGTVKEFLNGDDLIRNGQYIKTFPLVLEGSLKIFRLDKDGNEILLYFLNPGEVCSMALTCCMEQSKSTIRAQADNNSMLVLIPVRYIDEWMIEYKSWKEFVMYSYRKRFNELLDTIDSIAFRKMDERLVKYFQHIYQSTGRTTFSGTHQEIANDLNSSREVISRLLKQLEKDKKVELSRNKVDFSFLCTQS